MHPFSREAKFAIGTRHALRQSSSNEENMVNEKDYC
jgi:hypothetical protein